MPDSVWENFLAGTITNYNAKIQAEKDAAEAERVRLQEEEAERERIRLENEQLRKEAEEREKQIEQEKAALKAIRDARSEEIKPYVSFIDDLNTLLEADEETYLSVFNEVKQTAEAQWEADRQKAAEEEKERNRLIDEQKKKNIEEAKKRKEAEEQAAKLQKELDDRKRKEEEEAAAKEAELGKGDKAKMESLIKDLNELKTKYSFKSKKHTQIQAATNELIGKIVTYIESKV
jgi:colicin import membrane protein